MLEDQEEDLPRDEQLAVLQEELSKLSGLRKSPGYEWLLSVAKQQQSNRIKELVFSPLGSMDEVLRQEFQKGEIQGIHTFISLVDTRISDLKDQIGELQEEMKDESKTDDAGE